MINSLESLLKSKEIITNKIDLNEKLLMTIQELKQDETTLQEECKAYRVILNLINKEIRKKRIKK
jgi:hypothetical protein